MHMRTDDLTDPRVLGLLEEHLANMHELSPPDQVFAFDASRLRAPGVTFWTVWDGDQLLGCGALKELSATEGEIKSMRTPRSSRRRGAGRAVLLHIIAVARARGYARLSLETGSHPDFGPAHVLYRSVGFAHSGPFGDYAPNDHSVFMSLELGSR